MLAGKSSVEASRRGDVLIPFQDVDLRLNHVLIIPGLGYKLVSVGRLADNGIPSLLKSHTVELRHND